MKGRICASALALAAFFALAGTASASTTIGSNLAGAPNQSFNCGQLCTEALVDLGAGLQAPGGLSAPADGVVVEWSVKVGPTFTAPARLRIVRPDGFGGYSGAGTGQFENVQLGHVSFSTRLPIEQGDLIGIDADGILQAYRTLGVGETALYAAFQPALVDGAAPASPTAQSAYELMIQAEIEPDTDGDGFGDETQDQCPTDPATAGPCDADGDGVADPADACPAVTGSANAAGCPDADSDGIGDASDNCPQAAGVHANGGCPVPETTLTQKPKNKTAKRKAAFAFTSSLPGAKFDCRLDGGAYAPCTSPHKVRVKRGRHTFSVRAVANGVTDPTPAQAHWKVKRKRR